MVLTVSLRFATVASLALWLSLTVARADAFEPYSARYRLSIDGRPEQFELLRTERRIEHRYLTRGESAVWQRDARGEVSHWKLYEGPLRSIHYTPGDLRTIHGERSWDELATLVTDPLRSQIAKQRATSRKASGVFSATAQASASEWMKVVWNATLALPNQLIVNNGRSRVEFRRIEAHPCKGDGCPESDLSRYREIEFADLGDSEHDPFVRKVLATLGRHSH